MGGEKGKIDLLLKFFDSQHFDAWVRPAFERCPLLLSAFTSSYQNSNRQRLSLP